MPATKPSAPDQWYIVYTRDFECTVAVHFREEGGLGWWSRARRVVSLVTRRREKRRRRIEADKEEEDSIRWMVYAVAVG